MSNDVDEKELEKLVERRLEELQVHSAAFLKRFDGNGDGILSRTEFQAAIATLRQEILTEKKAVSFASCKKLDLETVLKGRYRVISQIGSGAQSNVYAARDQINDRLVVLKQMRISDLNNWESYDAFQREFRILGEIDHPKIPASIDFFSMERNGEKTFILVQSYLVGDNLETILGKGRLFKEKDLISIARQCLQALRALHENDPVVLHRDIKPSNLLLDEDNLLSLVDFGVVQYAADSKTLAMGTSGYMAPEQLVGQAVPQSDLYSLGVCLIRLATRKKPGEFELLRSRLQWRDFAALSEGFSNWIDRLIDPESEDRFESAREAEAFLDTLHEVKVNLEGGKHVTTPKINGTDLVRVPNPLKDSDIRIWTSVELLVMTIGSQKRIDVLMPIHINGLRFTHGMPYAYGKYGWGFSLTSDSLLEIRCAGWRTEKMNLPLISPNFDEDGSLVITSRGGKPLTPTMTEKELDYVWKNISDFCKRNGLEGLLKMDKG